MNKYQTLNEYALTFYGCHWVMLSVRRRRECYDRWKNPLFGTDFGDLLGGIFGGN